MKTVKICGAALVVLAMFVGQSTRAGISYDPSRPLTTLHGPKRQNAVTDLAAVLDGLASGESSGNKAPVVLYVHGRGNEPKKSFQDTLFTSGFVLNKLEQQGVRVVGFNWHSKIGMGRLCQRPVQRATSAAADLKVVFQQIEEHKKKNAGYWQGRRLVLLAHSMGNIVVAQALSDRPTAKLASTLFDAIVLSASDTQATGHNDWLDYVQPGKAYVLSNPNDRFLIKSMNCEGRDASSRLGLSHADDAMDRSVGVTYIQVSAGERHRYISRGGQEGNPYVCNTVRTLLRGERPEFPSAWVISKAPLRIKIPTHVDRNDRCFSGVERDDKESDNES